MNSAKRMMLEREFEPERRRWQAELDKAKKYAMAYKELASKNIYQSRISKTLTARLAKADEYFGFAPTAEKASTP
jgi:hypothetical protein